MNVRSRLTVALVGPFPPPYGGMGVYFSAIEAGVRQQGMVPLREDGWAKVADGITTVEEVLRVSV